MGSITNMLRNYLSTCSLKLQPRHCCGGFKYFSTSSLQEPLLCSPSASITRPGLFPNYSYFRTSYYTGTILLDKQYQNPCFRSRFPFNRTETVRTFHTSRCHFDDANEADKKDKSLAWMKGGKIYDRGPDQMLPSKAVFSWNRKGAVYISGLKSEGLMSLSPISVPTLLSNASKRFGDKLALFVARDGVKYSWTYAEYLHDIRTVAKGFIALGLQRFHSVCIIGFNSPEWFISDFGAIFAGGFAAGMYTTNSPEACQYCANHSKADIIVVEDEEQLEKILQIRSNLPHLKAIIQYTGKPTTKGVISWAELMELGSRQPDKILEERLRTISVNQCCTLIYTSGKSKGCHAKIPWLSEVNVFSHDNLTWMAQVVKDWGQFREVTEDYQETLVSFLPLSHVAAQMADIYAPVVVGGAVAFPDKQALKGTLVENMKTILPTKFLAVPRVWETMYEKISEVGRSTTGLKKLVAQWAKQEGLEHNLKKMEGEDHSESLAFKVANKIVLVKVREALGLNRCTLNLSGAAPISQDILKFFMALNIVVTEAYGLSESSGPHTMALERAFRLGSVGKTMLGCETKIDNPGKDGIGEILLRGRHITMGYLEEEKKTRNAIDAEGYFHTEDQGRVDADGYVFVTGRLKEILITAGGENVAPIPIEDRIKSEIPAVAEAVVLGDKLKFLSVLLTIKTEVDVDTQEPLDKLTPASKQWLEKNGGCTVNNLQDVIGELKKNNVKLKQAFQEAIDRVNENSVSKAQRLQKWVILPVQFSIPGGEIGPTLKLKRTVVYEKYKATIEKLYDV